MLRSIVSLAALALSTAGVAQGPPPAPLPMIEFRAFATSSEIQAMIAKAASSIKLDEPVFVQPLLVFAPYKAILEFRQGATGSAVHQKEAELFYVIEGAGMLTLGGNLTAQTVVDRQNLGGTGIAGGREQLVAAGDFFVIPENTPHWFNKVQGRLVMIAIKLPRSGPAAAR